MLFLIAVLCGLRCWCVVTRMVAGACGIRNWRVKRSITFHACMVGLENRGAPLYYVRQPNYGHKRSTHALSSNGPGYCMHS